MYTNILVPLDGSKLAECVLPHVEAIASGCGTQEITLISVTEKIKVRENIVISGEGESAESYQILSHTGNMGGQMYVPIANSVMGDRPSTTPTWYREVGKKYSQADKYLDRIQRSLIKKGLNVQTAVLIGNPADAIVSFASKNGIDLIIMASHGRSGISRWASGSVTDRVFRSSCVPVLMVRAPGCIPGF
jgi:nucleotide-binding universal stress UspA family protein